jgi:hypothetical protein
MRIATVNVTTDLGDEELPVEEGRRSTYGASRRGNGFSFTFY